MFSVNAIIRSLGMGVSLAYMLVVPSTAVYAHFPLETASTPDGVTTAPGLPDGYEIQNWMRDRCGITDDTIVLPSRIQTEYSLAGKMVHGEVPMRETDNVLLTYTRDDGRVEQLVLNRDNLPYTNTPCEQSYPSPSQPAVTEVADAESVWPRWWSVTGVAVVGFGIGALGYRLWLSHRSQ